MTFISFSDEKVLKKKSVEYLTSATPADFEVSLRGNAHIVNSKIFSRSNLRKLFPGITEVKEDLDGYVEDFENV